MTANSAPSPVEPGKPNSPREFTEKWLQALSLSAAHPAAQRIKPLFNDMDCLCIAHQEQLQFEAAKRLWDFAGTVGLQSLLTTTPFQQDSWRFDDDEAFVFTRPESFPATTFDDWVRNLGLQPQEFPMIAIVNQGDWSELIRNEAIRLGQPLKVIGSPPSKESLLWKECIASWDRESWTFRFSDPSWITKRYEGGFVVSRPAWDEIEGKVFDAIGQAARNLTKGPTATDVKIVEQSWMQSIPILLPLHRRMVTEQSASPSPWLFRVWNCVWPVVYREQNRLRGSCDIESIRRDLELCFRSVPQLVLWSFVLGRLICQHQLGRGLGICGEFK